jgi:hypothetical protein
MADSVELIEKRQEHRQRVLKGAYIITTINESEIACTVRNLNSGGAELRVPAEFAVPEEFLLHISVDGTTWKCARRWRVGGRVGVRFLEQTRKPAWHCA